MKTMSLENINKDNLNKKYGIFLVIISVMPFFALNIILSIIFKKPVNMEQILPPSFATASLLGMFYIYKNQLVVFDYEYYANIDFLKRSSAYEKKTVIEKLTAAFVHEIKNPIAAISSLNQQLIERVDKMDKEEIKKYLIVSNADIERIKNLINDYLKTAKHQTAINKENINLYDFFISLKDFINFELKKKNINFLIKEDLKNTTISFYKDKLKQIFLNLIYNAIEADSNNINIYGGNKEIFFEDDGDGINENQKDLIFKPFFTTKFDGIGIGLSIIKDILNEEMKNIELIESTKGKTVFKITL